MVAAHAQGTGQAEFAFAGFKMRAERVRLTLEPGQLNLHYEGCSGDSVGPAAYLTFATTATSLQALTGQKLSLLKREPGPYHNVLIPDDGRTRLKVSQATLTVEKAGSGILQANLSGQGLLNGKSVTFQGRVQGPVGSGR